jgi:LPS sulfotransferase NodH
MSDTGSRSPQGAVRCSDCLVSADYFVILAAMRTGSNLLQSNLNQYKDIVCLGELFNRGFVGVNIPGKSNRPVAGYGRDDVALRNRDEMLFFDRIHAEMSGKVFGFRMFRGQNDRLLEHVLQNRNCRKVILRRNALDSYISLLIAGKSDKWLSRNPDRIQDVQVRFSMKKFMQYLEQNEQYYSYCQAVIDATGQTAFTIHYEQLKELAELNRLARFLGSQRQKVKLKEKIYKQTLPGLEQKVVNYDAMVESLKDAGLYQKYVSP